MIAAFTLPGEPVSKQRPRFTKTGRTYTPNETLVAEKKIGFSFRGVNPGWPAGGRDGEFAVRATFYTFAKSHRDIDNMLKLVLDGLNHVAWKDDYQIMKVHAEKVQVATKEEARTVVLVYEVDHEQAPADAKEVAA